MRYGITTRPSTLLLTRPYQTQHITDFRETSLTILSMTCNMRHDSMSHGSNYFWLIVEFGCGKNHLNDMITSY